MGSTKFSFNFPDFPNGRRGAHSRRRENGGQNPTHNLQLRYPQRVEGRRQRRDPTGRATECVYRHPDSLSMKGYCMHFAYACLFDGRHHDLAQRLPTQLARWLDPEPASFSNGVGHSQEIQLSSIPISIKILLALDIAGCLFGAWTLYFLYGDYAARGVNHFFPVLGPMRLIIAVSCILVSIIGDVLLFSKSKHGFPFAWSGFGLVAAGLAAASIMHLTPSSPVAPANSAQLLGILIRECVEVVFNLIFLVSLLRLKRNWPRACELPGKGAILVKSQRSLTVRPASWSPTKIHQGPKN